MPLPTERVKLPGIGGIILVGMLIGPHGFDLIGAAISFDRDLAILHFDK